jgi:hypothetical protein
MNAERTAYDPTEDIFALAKGRTAGPAASLIDAAEALLAKVDSLEAFREQLIDLYAQSEPERLGEVLAQMEMLGNLSGRAEVAMPQAVPAINVTMPELTITPAITINNEFAAGASSTRKIIFTRDEDGNLLSAELSPEQEPRP